MALFNNPNPKKHKKKSATKKQPKRQAPPEATALAPLRPPADIPNMPKWEPKPFSPMEVGSRISPFESSFLEGLTGKKAAIPQLEFDPEKKFLKTFKSLTYQHRTWDVWNDFIIMAACALSNPVDKEHYDVREARYLRIINKYNKEEQNKFPELFAHLVLALEINPEQDFLGKLYTSLELTDKERKQEFTPYSVCELMAEVTMEKVVEQVEESGYVTLTDPCCGAGATLISGIHTAKRNLAEAGLNFQHHILVVAQDIDETVALMCYIQLSLLGVAAYVKIGNSLTKPMSNTDTNENYWFTPMYFSDVWAMRRLVHNLDELFQKPDIPKQEKKPFRLLVKLEEADCYCTIPQLYENVAQKAHFSLTDNSRFDCAKICCTQAVQDAVYRFYEENGADIIGINMAWANAGPRVDLDGDKLAVEIEDGFVTEGDD